MTHVSLVCALPPGRMSSSRKRRLSNPLPKLAEYSCSRDEKDDRAGSSSVLGMQLRGVNLHGWLVLQPWVTPSLFYQFEGKGRGATAFDMHGFCRVLGPSEANRQLRQHWRAWVTERDLARLASQGINTLRIPVGDWMWEPYEPYVGCTDGAIDELWRVIHLCKRVGLQARALEPAAGTPSTRGRRSRGSRVPPTRAREAAESGGGVRGEERGGGGEEREVRQGGRHLSPPRGGKGAARAREASLTRVVGCEAGPHRPARRARLAERLRQLWPHAKRHVDRRLAL